MPSPFEIISEHNQSLRSMQTLESLGENIPSSEKRIECIVEIVSCRNLLATDSDGLSDPYVEARLGGSDSHIGRKRKDSMGSTSSRTSRGEVLHRTKFQRDTLNPRYLSSFHLDCNAKSLFHMNGLKFYILSKNTSTEDDDMGSARLPYEVIEKAENIPREYRITLDDENEEDDIDDDDDDDDENETAQDSLRTTKTASSKKNVGFIKLRVMTIASRPSEFEKLDCTIEIVSCRNLLAADSDGLSDPYVTIWLGDKQLHRTDHIKDTLNPYYYVTTKSKFDFKANALEVFENGGGGLDVEVMDYDEHSSDDELGMTLLPYGDICRADGIPREYNLTIEERDIKRSMADTLKKGDQEGNAGIVTIKCYKKKKNNTPTRVAEFHSLQNKNKFDNNNNKTKLDGGGDDKFDIRRKRESLYQKFSKSFRVVRTYYNNSNRNMSDLTEHTDAFGESIVEEEGLTSFDDVIKKKKKKNKNKNKNDLNLYYLYIFIVICIILGVSIIIINRNKGQKTSSSTRQAGGLSSKDELLQNQQLVDYEEEQDLNKLSSLSSSTDSFVDTMIDEVYSEEQELKNIIMLSSSLNSHNDNE